jgi:hypothetical protein
MEIKYDLHPGLVEGKRNYVLIFRDEGGIVIHKPEMTRFQAGMYFTSRYTWWGSITSSRRFNVAGMMGGFGGNVPLWPGKFEK